MKTLIMASIFIASAAHAKIPTWAANNSTKLNGSSLRTVCHGVGPSVDIARSEALKSCQLSASQFFISKIKVKSLSVETEKSVGYHQEVSSDDELSNLICDPTKDELEETDSQYSIWLECKFDLNRVKAKPIKDSSDPVTAEDTNLSYSKPSAMTSDHSSKTVFLSTIPKCESIIIKGDRPRTVECKSNPVELDISDADKKAIIRVREYKPKTIQLKKRTDNETIQVLFEK
ncbi:MAG TPA: hypothetical protein VIG33_15970 [Pseudobdellovibrionaceae bacterium]